MKQNKKIIGFALAFSIIFLAAGCSAVSGNPNKKSEDNTNKFTVTGNFSLAGAFPQEFAESLNQAEGDLTVDARVATSSFQKYNAGKPKFYIEAKKIDAPDTEPISNGSVTKDSDGRFNYSFTFDVPETEELEKWELTVYLYFIDKEKSSYAGSVPVELSKEGIVGSVPEIILKKIDTLADAYSDPESQTELDVGVPGGINLKFYSEVEDLDYIEWEYDFGSCPYIYESEDEYVRAWLNSIYVAESEEWHQIIEFENGVATFKSKNVPNGSYSGCFYFYKKNQTEPCYYSGQNINVYPGYITDSWYSCNKDCINLDEETGEYKFVITQDILDNFSHSAKEITPLDTPYILWNRTGADDSEANYITGFDVFETLDSSTSITPSAFPLPRGSNTAKFWFGRNPGNSSYSIYYRNPNSSPDGILNAITPSYAQNIFNETPNALNLIDLVKDTKENEIYGNGGDVTVLYYYINFDDAFIYWKDSGGHYFFTMYNLYTKDNYSAVVKDVHEDFIVRKNIDGGRTSLYLYYLSTNKKQINQLRFDLVDFDYTGVMEKILPSSQSWKHLILDSCTQEGNSYKEVPEVYELSDSNLNVYSSKLQFSDMFEDKGTVYALVKAYGKNEFCDGEFTINDDGEYESNGDANSITHFTSTGGVIRFSTAYNNRLTPMEWNNGNIILGLYTDLGDKMYYTSKMNGNYSPFTNLPLPGQAPLNLEEQYFYGAQKFVARKPDKLVIADDGGHCEGNNKNPKKRVVTVDLATESLSVTDVNVLFTTKYSASTSCYGEQ